jgi:hypothetical protein
MYSRWTCTLLDGNVLEVVRVGEEVIVRGSGRNEFAFEVVLGE